MVEYDDDDDAPHMSNAIDEEERKNTERETEMMDFVFLEFWGDGVST